MTGLMGSNDGAVAFLSEGHAAGLDVDLIARAAVRTPNKPDRTRKQTKCNT
jgi:hypothetical protein